MSAQSWTICIDWCGRPPTLNAKKRAHYQVQAATARTWREAGCQAARITRLPRFDAVTVECWGRYPDRRSLPDLDAIAPAYKAAMDGIVDAGCLTDDRFPYVRRISYLPPIVAAGLPAALMLVLRKAAA